LEEYRKILTETTDDTSGIKRNELRFALARLLLIADGENAEGMTELETAVNEGFDNIEAVEKLQKDAKISAANRDKMRNILNTMQRNAENAAKSAAESAAKSAAAQEQAEDRGVEQTESGEDDLSETNPDDSSD
jgi:tripartite-type tricarboxylate transporter receptor subunit TctC